MCGYWKVYDDVEQARRIFDSYDKCREFTAAQIRAGYSILQVVGMKHLQWDTPGKVRFHEETPSYEKISPSNGRSSVEDRKSVV